MRNKSNQNASEAQLNLPQRVSRDSLRLDVPSSPSVSSSSSTTTSSLSSSARFSLPRSPANYSDRFIPSRRASNFEAFSLPDTETTRALSSNNSSTGNSHSNVSSNGSDGREDSSAAYIALMRSELFPALSFGNGSSEKSFEASLSPSSLKSPFSSPVGNVLKFRSSPGACAQKPPSPYAVSPIGSRDDLCDSWLLPRKSSRKISRSPFKVLDAPALQDDFYLNLVDWSCHNILAVGLGSCVYLWSASSSKVTKLCDLGPDDSVSSVAWTQRGTYLAVGTNLGDVQIWDATHCKKVRSLGGHRTRAGTLAWNSHILSSGSRDRSILQRDVRSQDDFVSKFSGHKSEVCGLKWSYDDRELASGGNDNQLFVWNQQSSQPVLKFSEHTAAVKAIAWSPHQHGLLASGGGTADRCVRFWNTTTNTSLNSVDTGSQVCNLVWSKNVNEIVSTHGYSQNQIIVWRYPSMSKLATLTGHTLRVLYLAISPDGQTIVTGAGDETLRFWNVFPSSKAQSAIQDTGVWSSGRTYIR